MSSTSIEVKYNENLEPLEQILSGGVRTGDFFFSGTLELPMPKIEVAEVGVLSFPFGAQQIATLITHATRAPYGRGEQTILDESVRKGWQLPADRVQFSGRSWDTNFSGILQNVAVGLGCEGMKVTSELYKLLVYDEGGFFRVHRDTEKTGGMFATLVVILPSEHRGGDLII